MDDKIKPDMEGLYIPPPKGKHGWGMAGAVITAVAASACCAGPLVLLLLGVSGAWIGNLTALEPYRPLFILAAAGFLGFAFYRVYRKPREVCDPKSQCAGPGASRFNKVMLWLVTVLVAGMLVLPWTAPRLVTASGDKGQNDKAEEAGPAFKTVLLKVKGMTCGGCTATVKKALTSLEGVADVKVTLNPPEAVVTYDPEKVTTEEMMQATKKTGYPSSVEQKKAGDNEEE